MSNATRKTLVEHHRDCPDVTIDRLRKVIRRTPELKALGTVYGAVRTYTRAEFARIAEAAKDRRKTAAAS